MQVEVIHKTRHSPVLLAAIVNNDAGGKLAGNGAARCLVSRLHPYLELWPHVLRHFGRQVAHAMGKAALAPAAWEAHFDRLDNAGCAVRGPPEAAH